MKELFFKRSDLKEIEEKNAKNLDGMIEKSLTAAKESLKKIRDKLDENMNTREQCANCDWTGFRKNMDIVGEQGTPYFFLTCPNCGRTVKKYLSEKDIWEI